ncbi:MAG: hypothetical protein WCT46_00895 [Candidatus Gracilibacteria bacterium]
MKKIAILLSVLALGSLFAGCLTETQEITFTTQAYAYLVPSTDTLDFTTPYDTNAYISKVVCADEETLNAAGPALMSAYSKPETPVTGVAFNLALTKLDKFDGNLCDVYVVAYDESTTEETEATIRVNIGAKPSEEVVTGEVCSEETGECPVEAPATDSTVTDDITVVTTDATTDALATDTTTDTVTTDTATDTATDTVTE